MGALAESRVCALSLDRDRVPGQGEIWEVSGEGGGGCASSDEDSKKERCGEAFDGLREERGQ